MPITRKDDPRQLLKFLPSIEELLTAIKKGAGSKLVPQARTNLARRIVAGLRSEISEGTWKPASKEEALRRAKSETRGAAAALTGSHPRPVINATGVVLHTNLGRAPISSEALKILNAASSGYCNLEYDLESGTRGSRLSHLEELLCVLSGAEAALAVNNNAGAVLLTLDTMASGREVIVSRGQLVEIGGSFRMPEIMEKSGVRMVEVGTTNKTHLRDYERAINRRTGLILHVHQSNFVQKGFVHQVGIQELVDMAGEHGVPVMDDQGSGIMEQPERLGAPEEPTVLESLTAGVAAVTFSGDKLLGGSQAGIIFGEEKWISRMKSNPLARALRLDKLQLAVLETTLKLYLTGRADEELPVRAMVLTPAAELKARAESLRDAIKELLREEATDRRGKPALSVAVVRTSGVLGGGSNPEVEIPGWGVSLTPKDPSIKATGLERALRLGRPPVVARVSEEQVILTIRAVRPDQDGRLPLLVARAVRAARSDQVL